MSRAAFVTGATGFVGQHVVRALCSGGWDVTAMARAGSDRSVLDGQPVRWLAGDVTDAASIRIPEHTQAVFHIAADTSVWSGHRDRQAAINEGGTRNMLDAVRPLNGARFIHTSTFAVWGFQPGTFDETTPWLEDNDWINYVATKRAAERMVHEAVESGLDAVILNPAHILGPGDRHNWSRMFRMISENDLPGVPGGGGAFGDVREIAAAHLAAFEKGGRGENYLLGGEEVSMMQVVQLAGNMLNAEVPKRPSPDWLLKSAGWVKAFSARFSGEEPNLTPEGAALITHHMHCDSSKARAELGYRFTPIETLLRDTIGWMREEGLLI